MSYDGTELPLTRHPELYFSDGSVVLVCHNRLGLPTAFKVFRSLLSANSEVFNDVLSLDQPVGEETYDGCPVIHLPDDAGDMECLMKAMFFTDFISMNGPPPPWTVFFSVLRLSAKYNFYGLQRGMLHHLETAYPSTYEHYLARRDPNRLGLRYWGIEPSPAILFQLINFIRGCHAVHCLPFAFYEACQLFVGDSITYQLEGACPLSSTDFKAVILGATALQNDEIDLMRTIFTNKQANCECALTCSEEKSRLAVAGVCFAMWCGMPSTVKTSTSPLLDTPLSSFTPQADAAFCPPCWAAWDGTWKRGKRAMWDRLPEYFGLPPWDMLLREGKGEDADSRMSS